jgi:phenylalanyl-tRNA synthetase alpha chain
MRCLRGLSRAGARAPSLNKAARDLSRAKTPAGRVGAFRRKAMKNHSEHHDINNNSQGSDGGAASTPKHGVSNELGWPILELEGARPEQCGADLAELGSAHCARLMAIRLGLALQKKHGAGLEARGPWAIDAAAIWDKLGYGQELASLDGRYTRWLEDRKALRSQTSALIPQALSSLAQSGWEGGVLIAPGRVWRRDLRDKIHIGEPRQMDIWILRPNWRPGADDLIDLAELVVHGAAPKASWTAKPAVHPYTEQGIEVDAMWEGRPLEILEAGLASERLLHACGLEGWGGLAMGVGLDRLCMIEKSLPDIRLLDDPDPKAACQMGDLLPWRPWSRQPGCQRDISVAVDSSLDAERVVDMAAGALTRPEWLEGVDVVGRWEPSDLPAPALAKLGLAPGQSNWLLRLRLRDWRGSIPKGDADAQARLAWDALHQGSSMAYRPMVAA